MSRSSPTSCASKYERYCYRCRVSYPFFYSRGKNHRIRVLVFANSQKLVLFSFYILKPKYKIALITPIVRRFISSFPMTANVVR